MKKMKKKSRWFLEKKWRSYERSSSSCKIENFAPRLIFCQAAIAWHVRAILREPQTAFCDTPIASIAGGGVVCRRCVFFFLILFFFSHFDFPASGQTSCGHRCCPFSPPRFLPSIFIARIHRFQQSYCSSIFHRVLLLLTRALALSASQFVRKKKSLRMCTGLHAVGGTRTHETDLYQARGYPDTPPGRPVIILVGDSPSNKRVMLNLANTYIPEGKSLQQQARVSLFWSVPWQAQTFGLSSKALFPVVGGPPWPFV